MSIQERPEKSKILIVESNKENLALLSEIISPFYEVVAASPEEAFEKISNSENNISTAILYIKDALPVLKKIE